MSEFAAQCFKNGGTVQNQMLCDLAFMKFCHSLIIGVLIQSCSAGAKNFTNYVFCHPQFSGVSKILKIVVPF